MVNVTSENKRGLGDFFEERLFGPFCGWARDFAYRQWWEVWYGEETGAAVARKVEELGLLDSAEDEF